MNTDKDTKKKNTESFNRKKIENKLEKLKGLITGRGLSLVHFTAPASSGTKKNTPPRYSEKKTRKLVDDLMLYINEYCGTAYGPNKLQWEIFKKYSQPDAENYFTQDYIDPNERIFLENLLYCSIRIALYEEKAYKIKADLNSILQAAVSLDRVYSNKRHTEYELFFKDQTITCPDPASFIKITVSEGISFSMTEEDIYSIPLSILDKVNLYYLYLTNGDIPVFTDIKKYETTDPKHFLHLKERKGNLEKEMKNVSKGRDEYNEQFHEMYGSMIDEYDLVQEETFQSATESGSPPMHEYKLDTAFENPDEFIKACELFRFYLYNESKKHIQPRYPFVYEKIEYAIGRYISDSDICGFSDTDKSVYIYMLLSQVEDILIEKMGVE